MREIEPDDSEFLWEMLHRASWSHLDPDSTPLSIRHDVDLAHYVESWGRPGDVGVIACEGERPVGAAWVRLHTAAQRHASAYVADDVPELAIAVAAGNEGRGLGSQLLASLLARLPDATIVLTARSTNPAIALYRRHGFRVVETITNRVGTESVKMIRPAPGASAE